ncbi:N-6 DNA methylase [Desulfopila sp. IMCC35008]|uniref:N-6 DNA methylase n=1 Tax=Desulfopila sp. IMCC35008 TaxID=2653858 RepID=UPI0013D813D2|nr:N-6 DNA methylase [Desulfopila sp. IMCC35008]
MTAIKKEFETKATRKKRLGQYYTGLHLAKLLAALAQAQQSKSVLDPMAGIGDMLVASHDIGARPKVKGAIEIDPIAREACAKRVKSLKPLLGNAFDFSLLSQLPTLKWDLVITNPPYVRYQSMTKGVDASLKLPNATEIRSSLISAIKHLPNLDKYDKQLFLHLCQKYSGLADLAVPSWILCAALVKKGGTLAIVVPDSWLNREYALPIQYILLRWFKIRYIVEDINSTWFDKAQVKTNLLVAERITRRDSAFDWSDEGFVHICLSKDTKCSDSFVGNIFPGTADAEVRFAQEANRWYDEHTDIIGAGFSVQWTALSHMSCNLQSACVSQGWLSILGESEMPGKNNGIHLPSELSHWLGKATSVNNFHSLNEIGVHVGQGLRTGANRFFYADFLEVVEGNAVIAPSPLFGIRRVQVPPSCIAPVLRKQTELPDGYILNSSSLKGCVLTLHNHALPEDLTNCDDASYDQTPPELATLIRIAYETNFGTTEEPKRVYELSAVAPNIRKSRFWYMLPDFTPRHTPDLFIARVNNENPKTFLNMERASIIDANFSTIWLGKKPKVDAYALLAFFNCLWSLVVMELSASVMGGGALKVEATHLRKVPVPDFKPGDWSQLSNLGKQLAEKDHGNLTGVMDAIDKVVVSRLTGTKESKKKVVELRHLAQIYLERRLRK